MTICAYFTTLKADSKSYVKEHGMAKSVKDWFWTIIGSIFVYGLMIAVVVLVLGFLFGFEHLIRSLSVFAVWLLLIFIELKFMKKAKSLAWEIGICLFGYYLLFLLLRPLFSGGGGGDDGAIHFRPPHF